MWAKSKEIILSVSVEYMKLLVSVSSDVVYLIAYFMGFVTIKKFH